MIIYMPGTEEILGEAYESRDDLGNMVVYLRVPRGRGRVAEYKSVLPQGHYPDLTEELVLGLFSIELGSATYANV